MSTVTRSPGVPTGHLGLLCGSGVSGATDELDALVADAAEALRQAYGRDVVIRFNSDRRSGGAWIVTHAVDAIGRNAELGITAGYWPEPVAHAAIVAKLEDESLGRDEWLALFNSVKALPRVLLAGAYIGRASLRDPAAACGYFGAVSIGAALAFLKENAILREEYS